MPAIVLFAFYFIILFLVLNRLVKTKQVGINTSILFTAFAFKVLLGCAYGYIFQKYYGGDDTWMYHNQSLPEYQKLVRHPIDFLKDFLPYSAFAVSHNFLEGMKFYTWDLENWSTIKLLAVFNIFSRGNYYINVLFFDFFVFGGPLLLFKLLSVYFPGKKTVLIICLFFIPSVTFWLSGIRSEGLLLLCMAIAIYYSYKWFLRKKIIYPVFAVAGLAGVLIFRSQFLFTLVPAFLSWTLSFRKPQKAIYYFCIIYLLGAVLFFGSVFVSEKENFPVQVAKAQQEFLKLHANTRFALDTLQPSVMSFAKILPQAFSNTLLRPFIWEAKGVLQIATAIGIMASWVLLLLFIFYHEKKWNILFSNPLLLLFIFYSITQILLIGYTVPFPGAITRYKAIPELLMMVCLVIMIDWKRLFKH